MKHLLKISLLAILCFFTTSNEANAQFWKKIFGKEEQHKSKKTPVKAKPAPPKEAEKPKKKTEPEYPESVIKTSYQVDVLLPLYLNTLVKDGKAVYPKAPEYAMGAINFYEGITIAANAMNKEHLKLEINIHDITDPDNKPELLTKTGKLDKSDLIIGYVQSNDIADLANFAKKHTINFISALSPADADVKDNPYFLLLQPTLTTHLEQLVDFAKKQYNVYPKYLLYSKQTGGEKAAYEQIKSALKTDKNVQEIDCSDFSLSPQMLAAKFDSNKVNILFVSILDLANAEKILNAIAALPSAYHFQIFGMPSWKYLKGLTQASNYMKLSVHYTTPFYYDPTTASGRFVSTEYKTTYGAEPTEFVYRGYETMYWLSHLLEHYGTIFNPKIKDVSAAPFTRFEIKPSYNKDSDFLYQENTKLYILHYQNGGYVLDAQ